MPRFSLTEKTSFSLIYAQHAARTSSHLTCLFLRPSDDPSPFNPLQEWKRLVGTDLSDRVSRRRRG